jgi:membrane protein DedA with SNARE-associated domain
VEALLAWIDALPPWIVYAGLGAGAAIENVVPAVPADTFVVIGAFLSALGGLQVGWVFAATWSCNVASALVMYRVGHVHGRPFFESGWGRKILNPRQLERVEFFYHRWGTTAIFFTRFLPGLRAVVPVFAGVTHQRFIAVAVPLMVASAIWYGLLVWAGAFAGYNLEAVQALLAGVNLWLLAATVLVGGAVGAWWWRTRHHEDEHTP